MNTFPKAVTRWWRWSLLGLGLSGIMLLFVALGAFFALSWAKNPLLKRPLTAEEKAVFGQSRLTHRRLLLPELSRPVNILVMGMSVLTSDVRHPSATKNLGYLAQVNAFDGLSDVLLLLHFDPRTDQLTILSIPRDTRVVTEDSGVIKINAANVLGGPAKSASVVSQLLLVPIDRYVRVNVLGTQQLVDALGGVTVNVPKDLKYVDESQHLYINLKAGRQHLNGEQTLQLLRFRHDEQGDIGRIGRQQLVMRALIEQKLNLLLLVRLPQVLSVIQSNLDSNLQGDEIVALSLLANANRQRIRLLALPGEVNGNGRYRVSYWIPDDNRIRQMVRQYLTQ